MRVWTIKSRPDLIINQEHLFKVLKGGSLPLLLVNEHQSFDELSVDIVHSTGKFRYVALFHVWAHGLANPSANALPRCQLSYLRKVIRQLDIEVQCQDARELYLWCDTLCCPVEPREAKDLAWQIMYSTYKDATHILVLEASLIPYHLDTLNVDEVCVRILTSPWMRRLWTLQEGALPARTRALPARTQRLWFQFRDRAINIHEIRIFLRASYFQDISRMGFAGDMLMRFATFANSVLKDPEEPGADLETVLNALHHRSIRAPSDKSLLIATMWVLKCRNFSTPLNLRDITYYGA